ncbi:hypothetical protein ACFWXO_21875 [Kitasatospora sp. NPDC059088]|uniref:hypothetical protein n=1 Tax=Kitasatospora sp. NPDC059088 TaxID=3346722 RepID=UPI0036CFE55E
MPPFHFDTDPLFPPGRFAYGQAAVCTDPGRRPHRRGRPGPVNILLDATYTNHFKARGLTILQPHIDSNTPMRCRRDCGHELVLALRNLHTVAACPQCTSAAATDAAARSATVLAPAGYQQIEPYPGYWHYPWRARHDTCGNVVITTAAAAADLTPDDPCRACRALADIPTGSQAGLGWQAANERALQAGLIPLESYQLTRIPQRCLCTSCGSQVAPTPNGLLGGSRCRHCATEAHAAARRTRTKPPTPGMLLRRVDTMIRAHRLQPLSQPDTPDGPWPVRHALCHRTETLTVPQLLTAAEECADCQSVATTH